MLLGKIWRVSLEKRVHGLFGLGNPSWGPLFFLCWWLGLSQKNGQLTFTKNGRLMWFDEWKFAVNVELYLGTS